LNSSHESRIGFSTAPSTEKSHVARSVAGIDPACSTGHLSVRYWPGGRRAGSYPASLTFRSALPRNTVPTLVRMPGTAVRVGSSLGEFGGVVGPDAASYLQAMVSNDVEALGLGDSCEALLLTPKARVIAPLVVVRRGLDDFLLLTEPGLGETVRGTLVRSRFA